MSERDRDPDGIAEIAEATFDLVIVGSGCAGLVAALTASVGGASVMVVEKTRYIGGTSAMSGGGTWVPANHYALAAGMEDDPGAALTYIRAASPPGWQASEDELWTSYVARAPETLRFVEATTPL